MLGWYNSIYAAAWAAPAWASKVSINLSAVARLELAETEHTELIITAGERPGGLHGCRVDESAQAGLRGVVMRAAGRTKMPGGSTATWLLEGIKARVLHLARACWKP
jgi:hypothetical protein